MTCAAPLVSVVIPTRDRPHLLTARALRSALAQTLKAIEVIVVVDGPDPATLEALEAQADPRLRVLSLPTNVGPAEARNVGVRHAHAPWVALLDDDDEWSPDKLERQLQTAQRSGLRHPIVVCRYHLPTPQGTRREPLRFPRPEERLGDYLMARDHWSSRSHTLMSTVLFAGRDLFEKMPFRSSLQWHEDWDWLLWASAVPGTGIEGIPDVLATYHFHEDRPHQGTSVNWRISLAWAQELHAKGLLSDRAFVGFVVLHVTHLAAREGGLGALRKTSSAILTARPRVFELLHFASFWLVPGWLRSALRPGFNAWRGRRLPEVWSGPAPLMTSPRLLRRPINWLSLLLRHK